MGKPSKPNQHDMAAFLQFLHHLQTLQTRQSAAPRSSEEGLERIVERLYLHYKTRLLEIKSKLRRLDGPIRDYCGHDKNLKLMRKPDLADLQLGDVVKISLRKRQFKQFCVGGWNESMAQDFDSAGVVVRFWPDGEKDATVCFLRSGNVWVISRRCLQKTENPKIVLCKMTSNSLKIGDPVMVPYEDSVVRNMQMDRGSIPEEVLALRQHLDKIICFDKKGDAFVSFDNSNSLLLNIGLLQKQPEKDCVPLPTTQVKKMVEQYFPLYNYVQLRSFHFLVDSGLWNYEFSALIGCKELRVCSHSYDGRIGVSKGIGSNKKTHLIPGEFIGRCSEKKLPTMQKGQGAKIVICGERVVFHVSGVFRFLREMRLSVDFYRFLLKTFKVLGYNSSNSLMVEMNKEKFVLPTTAAAMTNETNPIVASYTKQREETENIAVGDTVILDTGPFPLAAKILHETKENAEVVKAMTSRAKLLAFDDDADEAILQYEDGQVFAAPSQFVTAVNLYLEYTSQIDTVSNSRVDAMKPRPVRLFLTADQVNLLIAFTQHIQKLRPGGCKVGNFQQASDNLAVILSVEDCSAEEIAGYFTSVDEDAIQVSCEEGKIEIAQKNVKVMAIIHEAKSDSTNANVVDHAEVLETTNTIDDEELFSPVVVCLPVEVEDDDGDDVDEDTTRNNDSLLSEGAQSPRESVVNQSAESGNSALSPPATARTAAALQPSSSYQDENAQESSGNTLDSPRHAKAPGIDQIRYNKDTRELIISMDAFAKHLGQAEPQPQRGSLLKRQQGSCGEEPIARRDKINVLNKNFSMSGCSFTGCNFGGSGN